MKKIWYFTTTGAVVCCFSLICSDKGATWLLPKEGGQISSAGTWRSHCLGLVLWICPFSTPSFSQAEAEEKKKAEAKARSRRESGKAPSYAVSRL